MEEYYRTLWQFKSNVVGWTLKVSSFSRIVHLLHKERNSLSYLPLNFMEKVSLIEQFHGMYLVLGLQAVDHNGMDMDHVHSIVMKDGVGRAQFDMEALLESLISSSRVDLATLF
jgi:hypothetical protein